MIELKLLSVSRLKDHWELHSNPMELLLHIAVTFESTCDLWPRTSEDSMYHGIWLLF